ncbi:MAG: hypothetical protein MZV49_13145 [Rhodopseudomonas palustris]|nr:hypothetical protein [Rhodopseudomonas palustris]
MLVGGVGLAVQTFVAQAEGGRRCTRASHATWVALMGRSALTLPFFALLALVRRPAAVRAVRPRRARCPHRRIGVLAAAHARRAARRRAVGRARILQRHFAPAHRGDDDGARRGRECGAEPGSSSSSSTGGIAGSAWATNVSMVCGLGCSRCGCSCARNCGTKYKSHLTWRPDLRQPCARSIELGLPMGAMYAADLFGMALFQLMQVRLSAGRRRRHADHHDADVDVVHAGHRHRARRDDAGRPVDRRGRSRLGAHGSATRSSALTVAFMGTLGVLVAAARARGCCRLFMNAADPQAADVVQIGIVLLWIAAGYQIFDGLQPRQRLLVARRGRRDACRPMLFFVLAWGVFVPLAHSLSFAPGQGWVDFLPQYGYGAVGGWFALLVYVTAARRRAAPAAGARARGRGSASVAPATTGSGRAYRMRSADSRVRRAIR